MVEGIPIFKVTLSEALFNLDVNSDKLFAYAIEANKGPIGEPIYVASKDEAKRIFGVNFAPHFYQQGAGLILYRVAFKDAVAPSLVYKAYTKDYTANELVDDSVAKSTVDVIKITSTTAGTPKHKINLSKSITSAKAYNLTVTIEGVGSKKYQNISSLENVVKKINNKFADYIKAELLVDEKAMLAVEEGKYLVKTDAGYETKASVESGDVVVAEGPYTPSRLKYDTDEKGNVLDTLTGGSNGKMLKTNGELSNVEIPDGGLYYNDTGFTKAKVITNTVEGFVGKEFYIQSDAIADNTTIYQLYEDENGEKPMELFVKITPDLTGGATYAFTSYADANGVTEYATGIVETVGGEPNEANMDTTLLYAYRDAFAALEDIDVLGVATLSNSEVVQNELVEHIEKLIDPEEAKYRFGCTAFLKYPGVDTQGRVNPNIAIDVDTLADSTAHIDNPFIVLCGQGVVFEEDGVRYNLLPHEAIQLYTGIRSKLNYDQAIFGGANSKILKGVVDVLPLTNDGADIYKEDRIVLNEAGVLTFLKRKENITFLQGVTTAQDDVVLSHENIMSIVVYCLRRLVDAAWPFMGEPMTEDIKVGFQNTLSEVLKNIKETDNSLMALDDYNIPPYDVEIRATTTAGFDEAGRLIRKNKLLAVVKIVPRGAIDAIELSVIVI